MYHFIESGLPNIWLRNGYTEENSPYGPTVAFEDIFGLHRAIAMRSSSATVSWLARKSAFSASIWSFHRSRWAT